MDSDSAENKPAADGQQSFEEAVQELEAIVQRMSSGDQSLETSISEFERGVTIVRKCQKMLEEAEQRVSLLTRSAGGQVEPQPFEPR